MSTKDFGLHVAKAIEEWQKNNPDEYVNPHYLGEVTNAVYDDEYAKEEPYHIYKWCNDMWGH